MSNVEYIFGRTRGRLTASHFHLILSYNENTQSIIPNFWSHSLVPRFHGSSHPGGIISSHRLHMLLELNVEGTRAEIFAVSPIVLQSQCKHVPNEPIPTYSYSWPERQTVCSK